MKRQNIKKTAFILLLMAASFYYMACTNYSEIDAANLKEISSYPVSYISRREKLLQSKWITRVDDKIGYTISIPDSLSIQKFNRKINTEIINNITSINNRDNDQSEDTFDLEIIPIKSDSNRSALNILETYLVSYVGVIPKNNQKTYVKNNFEIAQIGFNPFSDDNENYFRVYTLIKKDLKAWVLTIGYNTDFSKSDSLDFENDYQSKIYREIIDKFKMSDKLQLNLFNNIDTLNLDSFKVDQYLSNNNNFITNLNL